MKKHLPFLLLTTLSMPTTTILTINLNKDEIIKNDNYLSDIKSKSPDKNDIKLNINKIYQKNEYYCVPAVIQTVFEYFGFSQDQDYIYQQLDGVGQQGIPLDNPTVNWINNQLDEHHVNSRYYRTEIPANFGRRENEQLFFQNYVLSALNQRVPIIMASQSRTMPRLHATIIYGIEVNEENPAETIYYYQDPMRPRMVNFFEGSEISGVFSGNNGTLIGPNNNFDFRNLKINISVSDQRFSGNLQNKITEQNQGVNLSKEAGINKMSQLKKFSIIENFGFNIKTTWFDKSYEYKDESWQTRYFIDGQTGFKKYNSYSWYNKYRNVATGQFDTFYSSSTWKEDDGSFYLNLTYQFFAKTLLTTTLIYAEIFLGTKWVLKF